MSVRTMFSVVVFSLYVTAVAATIDVTYAPKEFANFRTGEKRTLTVQVRDSSESPIQDVRNLSVKCVDTFICKVLSYPDQVILIKDENYSASFRIEIEALFIGVTQLNITVGNEPVEPYALRLHRSNRDEIVTSYFTIFIAIFVVIISFMMGTQLEPKRIMGIVRKPVGPTVGFFCQFGLMPTLGFLLAEYGLPADAIATKLALFSVSTCPGGGKSSFWTIIFSGNLDLSISMTFTQTLAALVMMPLWMSTAGKHFTDAHVKIPFGNILSGLAGLMVPSAFGMVMAHYRPQYIKAISKWIKRLSWAAMIVISCFAIYANYYIFWLITWPIVLCGCALPWLGYLTALIIAMLFRQEWKDCITIAIETGIQNIGIAMLLVLWCLPEPEASIAVTIIFVVAIMTDKPLLLIWLLSRLYMRCCKGDTVAQTDDNPKKLGNISLTDAITSETLKQKPVEGDKELKGISVKADKER